MRQIGHPIVGFFLTEGNPRVGKVHSRAESQNPRFAPIRLSPRARRRRGSEELALSERERSCFHGREWVWHDRCALLSMENGDEGRARLGSYKMPQKYKIQSASCTCINSYIKIVGSFVVSFRLLSPTFPNGRKNGQKKAEAPPPGAARRAAWQKSCLE